jgi:hypothetical protein
MLMDPVGIVPNPVAASSIATSSTSKIKSHIVLILIYNTLIAAHGVKLPIGFRLRIWISLAQIIGARKASPYLCMG